ncbi:MAG: alternative ribosome rescue aminoacyl-tRNA hydrolase ArfB, partial [Actinomycetota bacterium]
SIPAREIKLSFETSGGPGGQHANKAATRVVLEWNVNRSEALGPRQRTRIAEHLRRRMDGSGTIRLTSDRYRSQMRNREDALDRLAALVGEALKPRKTRLATKPSAGARERRLEQKRRRAEVKRDRGRARFED